MSFKVRPYQHQAAEWLSRRKRGAIIARAGLGKTVILAYSLDMAIKSRIRGRKVRIGWMANTREQCQQAQKAMDAFPLVARQDIKIACAAAATDWSDRDVLVVDECFPAGTLVDGRPIERIKVGDFVDSLNHATGMVEKRRVLRLFKSKATSLVEVSIGGKRIFCTPGHPFWNGVKYVAASSLTYGDMVLNITGHENNPMQRLQGSTGEGWPLQQNKASGVSRLQESASHSSGTQGSSGSVLRMRGQRFLFKLKPAVLPNTSGCHKGEGLLFNGLQESFHEKDFCESNGRNEQEVCFSKDEGEQSNVSRGFTGEAEDYSSGNGLEASRAWWKRAASTRPANAFSLLPWMADGGGCKDQLQSHAVSLQAGYSEQAAQGLRGGGRLQSQLPEGRRSGQKEGGLFDWRRVDSVKVLQRTSDGTFGGVCPEGAVFNIEVEGNNNYFANGILVHNCHHLATAPSWQAQVETCKGAIWLMTATPPEDPALLAVFMRYCEKMHVISSEHAANNLAPAVVRWLDATDPGLKEPIDREIDRVVRIRQRYWSGDQGQLWGQVAFQKIVEIGIVQNHARNIAAIAAATNEKPTLVLVNQVDHGQQLSEHIPNSLPFHAGMGDKPRREAIASFLAGNTRCLVSTKALEEGFDAPNAEVLVIVSGGKSSRIAEQATGRVLRSFQGKTHGQIFDFRDQFHPLAAKHSKAREEVYRKLGYTIIP